MFYHIKELQFDARVSHPDPRFAQLLLEQFGGANGELSASMQYFLQAFACRAPYPDKYDMLMDIATEELCHLEIVGATIQMLLGRINGYMKDIDEECVLTQIKHLITLSFLSYRKVVPPYPTVLVFLGAAHTFRAMET